MDSFSPIQEQEKSLAEKIKEIAWDQITKSGPDTLSLDEICHTLNIETQVIAEYFPHRDLLLTTLMMDAYSSLGDSLARARSVFPASGQFFQRLMAFCVTYRDWALRFPERYHLIFGPQIYGGALAREVRRTSLMRTMATLLEAIRELRKARMLHMDAIPELSPPDIEQFFIPDGQLQKGDLSVYSFALVIIGRLHGLVSMEINGPIRLVSEGASSLFDFEVKSMFRQFVKF